MATHLHLAQKCLYGLIVVLTILLTFIYVGSNNNRTILLSQLMFPAASNVSIQAVTLFNGPKIILFWTDCSGHNFIKRHHMASGDVECGKQKHKCFVTTDRKYFFNSSAVIFHSQAHNLMTNHSFLLSLKRPPQQRWIYYNRESPPKSPGPSTMRQWNFLFNWTMTYRLDSDIIYTTGAEIIPNKKYLGGFDPKKNYLEGKKKTAIALISNCQQDRLSVVRKLKEYIDVDIRGLCGKPCFPRNSCYSLISNYKFFLAFENNICRDYLTEKTKINAFEHETVPVIISGANLSNPALVPPNSYINALDFKRVKDLADHLKHIESQPKLYNEFFKWRDHWDLYFLGRYPKDFPCHVCDKLYEPNLEEIKIYKDIADRHCVKRNCQKYPVFKD